jgi:hypothetical protein
VSVFIPSLSQGPTTQHWWFSGQDAWGGIQLTSGPRQAVYRALWNKVAFGLDPWIPSNVACHVYPGPG